MFRKNFCNLLVINISCCTAYCKITTFKIRLLYFNTFSAHPTNPVEGCADANPKTMLPNDT